MSRQCCCAANETCTCVPEPATPSRSEDGGEYVYEEPIQNFPDTVALAQGNPFPKLPPCYRLTVSGYKAISETEVELTAPAYDGEDPLLIDTEPPWLGLKGQTGEGPYPYTLTWDEIPDAFCSHLNGEFILISSCNRGDCPTTSYVQEVDGILQDTFPLGVMGQQQRVQPQLTEHAGDCGESIDFTIALDRTREWIRGAYYWPTLAPSSLDDMQQFEQMQGEILPTVGCTYYPKDVLEYFGRGIGDQKLVPTSLTRYPFDGDDDPLWDAEIDDVMYLNRINFSPAGWTLSFEAVEDFELSGSGPNSVEVVAVLRNNVMDAGLYAGRLTPSAYYEAEYEAHPAFFNYPGHSTFVPRPPKSQNYVAYSSPCDFGATDTYPSFVLTMPLCDGSEATLTLSPEYDPEVCGCEAEGEPDPPVFEGCTMLVRRICLDEFLEIPIAEIPEECCGYTTLSISDIRFSSNFVGDSTGECGLLNGSDPHPITGEVTLPLINIPTAAETGGSPSDIETWFNSQTGCGENLLCLYRSELITPGICEPSEGLEVPIGDGWWVYGVCADSIFENLYHRYLLYITDEGSVQSRYNGLNVNNVMHGDPLEHETTVPSCCIMSPATVTPIYEDFGTIGIAKECYRYTATGIPPGIPPWLEE